MTFTTSADQIVRKKTIAVFIIFTILTLPNLFHSSDKWIWYVSIFLVFMLLLLFTYLYKPLRYDVQSGKIIIRRLIGDIDLNIQNINRIDRIHYDLLRNNSKGGAFGYLGSFDTDFGKTKFFATRRSNLVMLTNQDNSKIILTPDKPEDFIETINKLLGS